MRWLYDWLMAFIDGGVLGRELQVCRGPRLGLDNWKKKVHYKCNVHIVKELD